MSLRYKDSSGIQNANAVISAVPCHYYGFTCLTGGANRTIILYDNASTAAGIAVEDFVCDGNKSTDGHSHGKPVLCNHGLYLSIGGGTAVVYYSATRGFVTSE